MIPKTELIEHEFEIIIDEFKHTQMEFFLCIKEQFSEEEAVIFFIDMTGVLFSALTKYYDGIQN